MILLIIKIDFKPELSMSKNKNFILYRLLGFLAIFILLFSCETDITLKMPETSPKLVVEGHIEPGYPPMILLSHSVPYFSSTAIADLNNTFIHKAKITISNGTITKQLIEINLATLPDSIVRIIRNLYNIPLDTGSTVLPDFSFYTSFEMMGEENKTYTLNIEAEGMTISAVTTIPPKVIPDSFWTTPHITRHKDTLYELKASFWDPPNEQNYYRYFTKKNNEPFYTPRYGSVYSDQLFDGTHVKFTVERGEPETSNTSRDSSGYFFRGDTVIVKICTIDKAQFEFYSTLENDRGGGSPFSAPILVKSNIIGGLGIWGGYGAYYHTVYIPKK